MFRKWVVPARDIRFPDRPQKVKAVQLLSAHLMVIPGNTPSLPLVVHFLHFRGRRQEHPK